MVLWFCVQRWSRLEVPASAIGEVCEKVSRDMDQCEAKICGFRRGFCFCGVWWCAVVLRCLAFVLPEVCEEVCVTFRAAGWSWALVRGSSGGCLRLAGRSSKVRASLLPPAVRMHAALWIGSGVRGSGWSVGGGGASCRASSGGLVPYEGSF